LCENGIHRGALMDEEVSCIIAAKLEQVREALYTGLGCTVAVCCDESSAEQIKAALALFEEEAR